MLRKNIVKEGDELYINHDGKLTKNPKFKQEKPGYRFFALNNKINSKDVMVKVILGNYFGGV